MCSSNAFEPARAPRGLDHTMFSSALIQGLRKGYERGGPPLSFSELGDLVRENLREAFPESWVRPEVHSPNQREGDIAHIPLFPNPAYVRPRIAKDRAKPAQGAEKAANPEAPGGPRTRATQKAQPQKEVPARQAAGGKEKQVSAATARSASPAKSSKAKQQTSCSKGAGARRAQT